MSPSTRQRILDYLLQRRRASAPELGQALDMTRANMRYHLEKLLVQGEIELEPAPSDHHVRRGRPIQIFRLAMTARPNNLVQLANILLEQALKAAGRETEQAQLLSRLSQSLAGEEDLPRQMTQRLNRAVQILNQKRYRARWEARADAPQVIFRNCPYAAVLPEHPELCMLDRLLLEQLLKLPVEQRAKMDIFSSQPPTCIFAIGSKSTPITQD